jgi:uncharacterized protein YfaS (alpha-2-macroglobulin family)
MHNPAVSSNSTTPPVTTKGTMTQDIRLISLRSVALFLLLLLTTAFFSTRITPTLLFLSHGSLPDYGAGLLVVNFPEEVAPFGEADHSPSNILDPAVAPHITPAIAGSWRWQDGTRLVFRAEAPHLDLLPEKRYEVDLTKVAFRQGKSIEREPLSITLPPLRLTTVSCEWRDISDEPPPRRVFAPVVTANYPVYLPSVSNGPQLKVGEGGQLGYSLGYRTQYAFSLDSNPIVIPARDSVVEMTFPSGTVVLYQHDGPTVAHSGASACSRPLLRAEWTRMELLKLPVANSMAVSVDEAPSEKPHNYRISVNLSDDGEPIGVRGPAGGEVTEGIDLTPAHKGRWRFDDQNMLVFTPDAPFQLGEKFSVTVTKFPGLELPKPLTFAGEIPAPTVEITDAALFVDPINPAMRRLTATVDLSHPFLAGSLESRVQMAHRYGLNGVDVPVSFEVSYDEKDTTIAYLKSAPIEVRDEPGLGVVFVDRGVMARDDRVGTQYRDTRVISIPSRSEIFTVANAELADLVKPNGDVERILALKTSAPVDDIRTLTSNLELRILPNCDASFEARSPLCKEKDLTTWTSPQEVDSRVEAISEQVPVTFTKSDGGAQTTLFFSLIAPEKRQMLVTIRAGALARGGFSLTKNARFVLEVGRLKRELKIMHDGALLSFSGDKKLGLASRGVSDIRVGLRRIPATNAGLFSSLTSGKFKNPSFSVDLDTLAEEFSYEEPVGAPIAKVDSSVKDKKAGEPEGELSRRYSFIDFSKFMAKQSPPRGLFLLTVRSKGELPLAPNVTFLDEREAEKVKKRYSEKIKRVERCEGSSPEDNGEEASEQTLCDQRVVLITDLGLVAKRGANGEQDLYVMSFRSGKPVEGAAISLLGKNGMPIFSEVSGVDGHVHFPSAETFIQEREPTTYTVKKDGDFSFLPYERHDRRMNLSRFDTGGVFNSEEFNSLQGYIFSDRGIYRPGEQLRLGMVVRKNGWVPLPQGLPLELVITDPRNKEVLKKAVSFDASGFAELRWDSNSGGATGTYQASLHLMGANKGDRLAQIGVVSFRIDEFQPDRLNVKSEIVGGAEMVTVPHDAKAKVTVRNLFGSPAAGTIAQAEITVRPWEGILTSYPGYQFRRTTRDDLPVVAEKLGEVTTSPEGEAVFSLGLERYREPIFAFTVAGEGFEKGTGRSVVAVTSGIASSLSHLIGFKADGDLSFVPKGAERFVDLVAIDRAGERSAFDGLTAQRFEHRYESTLVRQPNGLYAYQSVEKTFPREQSSVLISTGENRFPLITSEPGRYSIVISDAQKQEFLSFSYTVAGEGNVTKSLERNAELSLALNKKVYSPGSEIEVNIVAPYSGSGIITIESDRVHTHQWFSTKETSSTHRIRVPSDMIGNGYVSVAFVRAIDSAEIFMSPLSYGVVPFSVSRTKFEAPVTMTVPQEVVPGDELPVTLTVAERSKVVMFAVDEGILQFARYKNPQPLDHFFRKRALQTDTFQILDLILPEFAIVQKLSRTGGDEDSGNGKYKNPFARRQKAPVAFWSGIVEYDKGSHQISIPIPEYFSGAVRILAVTASPERIGTATGSSLAKGPFVIQPQQPYAVSPGDEFDVGALIGNNTDSTELSVSVVVPDGLAVTSENPVRLELPRGGDAPIRFRVKAGETLGPVSIRYTVSGGETGAAGAASFSNTELISLRPAQPFFVQSSQGTLSIDDQRAKKEARFETKRRLYRPFRDVQVSVATTPLALLRGVVRFLRDYPYGCTEQIVSQAFPALVLGGNDELGFSSTDTARFIERALKTLSSRQQDSGGFGLWTRIGEVEPFYSVYGTHFLVEARKRGVEVPEYMFDEALRYLREYTASVLYDWSGYRAQAYALYVLALSGEVVTDKLRRLDGQVREATPSYEEYGPWIRFFLAATYKLLHLDGDAARLFRDVGAEWKNTGLMPAELVVNPSLMGLYLHLTNAHFSDTFGGSSGEGGQFSGYLAELAQEMLKGRPNSFSGSLSLLGLGGLWDRFGAGQMGGFSLMSQGESAGFEKLSLEGNAIKRSPIPDDATTFSLSGDGTQQLYYQLTEAGFERKAATSELTQGIAITRKLRSGINQEASSIPLTDKLKYEITLRPTKPVKDLAVIVLIPGGFEIDLTDDGLGKRRSLPVEGTTWRPEHIEIQEDRVMFFGDIGTAPESFAFALKPLTKGRYQVPPVFAEGMYDPEVQYRGLSGEIAVD